MVDYLFNIGKNFMPSENPLITEKEKDEKVNFYLNKIPSLFVLKSDGSIEKGEKKHLVTLDGFFDVYSQEFPKRASINLQIGKKELPFGVFYDGSNIKFGACLDYDLAKKSSFDIVGSSLYEKPILKPEELYNKNKKISINKKIGFMDDLCAKHLVDDECLKLSRKLPKRKRLQKLEECYLNNLDLFYLK